MQVNAIANAPRGPHVDDLLTLIRNRSRSGVADQAAGEAAPAGAAGPATADTTREAVTRINQALRDLATNLRFEIDPASDEVVVRVVDTASGEVLRQIPSEATLRIARSLDRSTGHLINHSI